MQNVSCLSSHIRSLKAEDEPSQGGVAAKENAEQPQNTVIHTYASVSKAERQFLIEEVK